MKLPIRLSAFALIPFALCEISNATDQNIRFNGTVLESCALTIGTDGTLGVSADKTVLSSEETGGVLGTVTAVTNGLGADIQVITPSSFSVGPASADTNTTFATKYALTGSTVLSEVIGTTVSPLGLGATVVSVNASATKSTGTFESGDYELVTVVRCTVD